jgi:hypothetical protein
MLPRLESKGTFGQNENCFCDQRGKIGFFVRMGLDSIRSPKPFQADGGSIPFTRSSALASRPSSRQKSGKFNMAEADLDAVIRSIGKKQHKVLLDAAKKRHGRLMGLAAKAKNKETKARYKQDAKTTLLLATAAARRLQITAENAADSYARAVKKAAEEKPAKKTVKKNKS